MRILVTGGTGFIGKHLAVKLRELGHEVCVTVVDVLDSKDCEAVLVDYKPEVVYHLAGKAVSGQTHDDSAEIFAVNALGTVNVFEASRRSGTRRFVNFNTSEAYGKMVIDTPGALVLFNLKEGLNAMRPITPYGLSKQTAERYCWMRRGDVEVVRLRGFNTYGPGQRKGWIANVIGKCLREEPVSSTLGDQTRDYVYIDDMVDGLVAAGTSLSAHTAGAINLCTGREISIAALNALIKKLTKSSSTILLGALPYRPVEITRMVGNNGRAKQVLNWEPKVSLEDGLVKMIDWCRSC